MKQFVLPSDPILSRIAEKIPTKEITSAVTKNILDSMHKVAYGEQKDLERPLLVGLAAPQIGISKRIILVDIKANGKGVVGDLRVFINPEIVESSDEQNEWYEGCFSTDRVCGIVSRPVKIRLQALDQTGKIVTGEYAGYTARIFQHEIDHLNGKEFTTHIIDDEKLHWVEENEFIEYRNHEAWRTWPNKCSREKWKRIKGVNA